MIELWTRVECLCGRVAAIPESGYFPLCGACGRRMVAPIGSKRVCLVADVLPVDEAVRRAAERGHPGVVLRWYGTEYEDEPQFDLRYAPEVLTEALAARGWPTEAQDWPVIANSAGGLDAMPPWEVDRG